MAAPLRRSVAALLALSALVAATPALAASGGTTAPAVPVVPVGSTGGVPYGANVTPAPKPAAPKKRVQMPTLTAFSVGKSRFTDAGTLPLSFRMSGTTGAVRVKLGVYSGGRLVASFDLGRRGTGATQRYVLSNVSARKLPAGNLILRLSGADSRGHHL